MAIPTATHQLTPAGKVALPLSFSAGGGAGGGTSAPKKLRLGGAGLGLR